MYLPKISIVIPAYHASNYLAQAIDSALAQTYPNAEIIVVNDGSRDGGATERVALSYGDRIRYIYKENGGSSSALNAGIAHMTGEWFSWLSHDDLYVPEKLEKQVAYMNGLGLDYHALSGHIFFSAWDLIDASGKTIQRTTRRQARDRAERMRALPHNGYLIAEPTVHTFHGCSCLIHRDVLKKVGGFDEQLRIINDVDLWYRLYAAGYAVDFIPESLVKGRIHGAQVSRRIGYSYHNPEQDLLWNRSLDWLIENHPGEDELFFLFGRNAYQKTRNAEGDRALAHAGAYRARLSVLKHIYKGQAALRTLAKRVYVRLSAR